MKQPFQDAVAIFGQRGGILRMAEALKAGVDRSTLYAMRDAGVLETLSRGVYRLSSLPNPESPDLITVTARVPSGVICLVTALVFHELTTQIPRAIDVALPRGAERPRIDYPPINVYWFSERPYAEGIETHRLDGRNIRVYGAEKSIADAFKYRKKLGMEVPIEALRNWHTRRGAKVETLLRSARVCRVDRVIRPYLEAML